jgi:PAS domain S-box-containing protein
MNVSPDSNLFEQLEESTNTGCWRYLKAENKIWWSKKTYDLHKVPYGTPVDVADGISYYHEDDRERIAKSFRDCVDNGTEMRGKYKIIDTEGVAKSVEVYGRAIFGSNKEIIEVFGTFKDISKEAFLREVNYDINSKLNHTHEMLSEFFILADTTPKGQINFVNENFCEISGYSKEELIGKDHNILNSGYHPKKFFVDMWKTISAGKTWESLICNKKKNGDLYWVQTFIMPKFNNLNDRKIVGYSAVRYDVTDKMELQKEKEREQEKQQFTSQLIALGEISAGIAHEISNPLAIIEAARDQLARGGLSDEKRETFLDRMDISIQRIVKIISGLHHLAQKSRGEEHEVQNLSNIVGYTFEFCEEALKSKFIKLSYEERSKDCYIKCDEVKISQILLNLINNARDAIETFDDKWIKIIQDKDSEYVYLSVVDSGNGIPEDLIDKIQEKFYTTKEVGKGTGLGLSLIKEFLNDHNGSLDIITDNPNTEFRIKVPIFSEFEK